MKTKYTCPHCGNGSLKVVSKGIVMWYKCEHCGMHGMTGGFDNAYLGR